MRHRFNWLREKHLEISLLTLQVYGVSKPAKLNLAFILAFCCSNR